MVGLVLTMAVFLTLLFGASQFVPKVFFRQGEYDARCKDSFTRFDESLNDDLIRISKELAGAFGYTAENCRLTSSFRSFCACACRRSTTAPSA